LLVAGSYSLGLLKKRKERKIFREEMPKLTVDLVRHSYAFINPLKERELDLRGI
jgi:hypothetical protein